MKMEYKKPLFIQNKEILRFENLDLEEIGLEKEFNDFMMYIDNIQYAETKALSMGQWKKLYACVKKIGMRMERNYCIYVNKWDIYFDITSNCLGTKEEISEDFEENTVNVRGVVIESSVDKFRRYKEEVESIDKKIDGLRKKRDEIVEKMEPLRREMMELLSLPVG